MKLLRAGLTGALLLGVVHSGCGPAPPCQTDLVALDETRLDVETYEAEVTDTSKQVADLTARLEEKRKDIESVEGKPEELRKRVHEMKKGSGRE